MKGTAYPAIGSQHKGIIMMHVLSLPAIPEKYAIGSSSLRFSSVIEAFDNFGDDPVLQGLVGEALGPRNKGIDK